MATYSTFGKAPGLAPTFSVRTELISDPDLGIISLYAKINSDIHSDISSFSQSISMPTWYYLAMAAQLVATVVGFVYPKLPSKSIPPIEKIRLIFEFSASLIASKYC